MPDASPHSHFKDIAQLVACPECDLLHERVTVGEGQRARCRRCGTVLMAPRQEALLEVIVLSLTVAILMAGATFFPFLDVSVGGVQHASSVSDTALAFSDGLMIPLAVAVLALIVVMPLVRVAALIYTLVPLARGKAPWRYAAPAFRLAEAMRPWSMAEVFMIGTTIALIKIGGLATIGLGPAFWAFAALVLVVALKDRLMCRWTIWAMIEARSPH